jgi:hypothetical protein
MNIRAVLLGSGSLSLADGLLEKPHLAPENNKHTHSQKNFPCPRTFQDFSINALNVPPVYKQQGVLTSTENPPQVFFPE